MVKIHLTDGAKQVAKCVIFYEKDADGYIDPGVARPLVCLHPLS